MQEFTQIIYVIDANDRLVSVSPEWTSFAIENDGEGLLPEAVAGRSLWDFIIDDATRDLYHAVLARARCGSTTDLVLRCDAPERRRLIEMIVTRRAEGEVEFRILLLAAKDRPAQRLFLRSTPRNGRHIMVCSWCGRVSAGAEEWLEVEEAMARLHLTNEAELPVPDPVVCPSCFAKVMEAVAPPTAAEVP